MKKFIRTISLILLAALLLGMIAFVFATPAHAIELEYIDYTEEDGVITVNSPPNYYQNYFYYSFLPYGGGTLGSSGCGITCMAMVATYVLDDITLTPDVLAMEYGTYKGTNIDKMEAAANDYDIPFTKTHKWKEVVSALKKGGMAIVLVNEATDFTDKQHFILITEIKDDKLMINDPNYRNYEPMQSKFENGFEQWQVIEGFQGAWIFYKDQESEIAEPVLKPFIWVDPTPDMKNKPHIQ